MKDKIMSLVLIVIFIILMILINKFLNEQSIEKIGQENATLEKSDNIINKKYYMPNTKHAKS